MLKIVKGESYEEMTLAVKGTGHNQCPCVPKYAWSKDTVCVCKEFREQEVEGHCHCGRYKKIKQESESNKNEN